MKKLKLKKKYWNKEGRNEVSAIKLKEGLEIFKVDIIGKIANLLKRKEKEDIFLKETLSIEKEIKDLISISKEKIISLKKMIWIGESQNLKQSQMML